MSGLIVTIVGGVVVAVIISMFGIGTTKVVVNGSKQSRAGKKLILLSWLMIVVGLILLGQSPLARAGFDTTQTSTLLGIALAECGVLLLIIGKVIAWYQKS